MKKIIILFCFLFGINYSYGQVNPVDSNALVDLYNSTSGASWTNKWDLVQPITTWQGVVLDGAGRVSEINLYNRGLQGSIPSTIGNLSNLQKLDLSNNSLNGMIPATIGNLSNLGELILQHNQLSGAIPTSICNLTNLYYLSVGNNQLSGTIPNCIDNLVLLTHLYLSANQLSGSIPTSICNLSNLSRLSFSTNQLSGNIPGCIGDFANLESLLLDNNQLSGTIPTSICALQNLKYLNLGYNQLNNVIPGCIGNLSNLEQLFLLDNQLSGSIPASVCNLFNLKNLWLNNNQLNGSIASCIGNLSNLEDIIMHDNQFAGNIPTSICNLQNLKVLSLSNNELSGTIPTCIGGLSFLEQLLLDNNQLNNSIPISLNSINTLWRLNLHDNCLSGMVPNFSSSQLSNFNVTNNSLTFNGIAQNLSLPNFYYNFQTNIPIYNIANTLYVNAGGNLSNNSYNWSDGTGNTQTIMGIASFTPPNSGNWTVTITNNQIPGLTLTGTMNQPANDCIVSGSSPYTNCTPDSLSLHTVGYANFLANNESCIVLTTETPNYQRGAVWNEFPIDLTQPFEFTASVNLGDIDNNGADGITFTLQNDVNQLNTLGNTGGYLGYTDITPSVAVEIDTWDNTGDPGNWNDIADDHIAVNLNGGALSQTTPISLGNVEDGLYHTLAVSWNPVTQTLSYSLDGISGTYTNDLINNIFNGNSQVLWGITGGTGYKVNEQIVCDMDMQNCTSCQVACGNCAQSIPNQVVNGDFELGNTHFSSGLTNSNQCTYGTYFVGHELLDKCASFDANTLDHTKGTIDGQFMVIDGDGANPTNIWSSNVNTQDGANYTFSFWVYVPAANNGHFPAFELSIDGAVVLVIPTTAIVTDNWVQYSANWLATQNGSSTLVIKQTNSGGFGKDYGIDDICFSGCIDSYTVELVSNNTAICIGDSVFLETIVTNALGGYTCDWTNNNYAGFTANQCEASFSSTIPGIYTFEVVVTDENDCDVSSFINIEVQDCDTVCCTDQEAFLQAVSDGFSYDFDCDSIKLQVTPDSLNECHQITWSWGDATNSTSIGNDSITHSYNTSGTYTVCMLVTEINDEGVACWEGAYCKEIEIVCNDCTSDSLSLHTVGYANFLASNEDCIVLTTETPNYQRGAVWNEFPIDLTQPFEFTASINLGDIDNNGADGITFTLQNDVNQLTTLGNTGGYLGYTDIAPSVAVEIDTWDNTGDPGNWNDIADDHIAVNLNGGALSQTTPISLGNVEDGSYHTLAVSWNPVTQTLSYSLDGIGGVYTNDLITNVFNGNTQVLWGITGGTGHKVNEQIVCDMDMQNCDNCQVACGNCAQSIPNQVINGDFELGNTHFSSGLTNSNQCTYGTYFVGHELLDKCASFDANTLDHTKGTIDGQFMIIDGDGANPTNIWSSNVNTQDGANYTFSFWVYVPAANNGHFPAFELIIDGVVILVIPTTAILTDNWVQYSANWLATQNGSSTLVIKQTNSGGFGKDYGIDDICFSGCIDSYTVELVSNNTAICIGDSVFLETIVTNALGGYTCDWTNNNYAGFTANQCEASFSSTIPGIYTFEVVVTDENDCDVSSFINIEIQECDTVCCMDEEAFFQAVSDGFTYAFDCDSIKLQVTPINLDECHQITWNWGDASNSTSIGNDSITHNYNTQGTYTVCMLVEEVNDEGVTCWERNYCEEIEIVCNPCSTDVKITDILTGNQHIIAGNTITATNIVEREAEIVYQAGNTIILKPGFHVKNGAKFTAVIAASAFDCPENIAQQDTSAARNQSVAIATVPQPSPKATLKVAPNPFRSEATINYFVPEDGYIQLTIRNINGQVVDKIVDGFVPKGWQEKRYQPNYLPAGIYFLVMQTEKGPISEKVVIQN